MVDARSNDGLGTIRDLGAKVKDDLAELREAAQRHGSELLSDYRRFVDRNPELAVGAAFGVGYVLSGGLVSRATTRLFGVAARLYLRRLMSDLWGGLAGELGDLLGVEEVGGAASA